MCLELKIGNLNCNSGNKYVIQSQILWRGFVTYVHILIIQSFQMTYY